MPDSAILFPKVHRQFPDTCDEGLWFIILWFMGEVKLKTKMTIMTNDQMTTLCEDLWLQSVWQSSLSSSYEVGH